MINGGGGGEAVVIVAPTILTQPQDDTIESGETATLSVVAVGGGLTYRWYEGASGVTTTPVTDVTASNSYTTPALTSDTSYWVRVTNSEGSVDSDAALITVSEASAFSYFRPDGTSSYLRPDGTSLYLRP